MAAFAISFLVLGSFLFWRIAAYIDRDLNASIDAVLTEARDLVDTEGISALQTETVNRDKESPGGDEIFLLFDAECRWIAGNLNRVGSQEFNAARCRDLASDNGRFDFEIDEPLVNLFGDDIESERELVSARLVSVTDSHYFMYGRVVTDLDDLLEFTFGALVWSFLVMLLLAVSGGLLVSRTVTGHLERLGAVCDKIRRGDFSSRVPLRNTEDEFDDLAATLNDMMDHIEDLMEGISEVSSAVAHDLRTPLSRLRNNLEELQSSEGKADLYIKLQESIDEADSLLATFNALLRIVQLDSGDRRRDLVDSNLSSIITEIVQFYQPVALDEQLALRTEICDDARYLCDPDLIAQAVSNILDNAIKYSPAGSEITVQLSESNGGYRLVVSDSGPGIPRSEREAVFERFYRLDSHRGSDGSGLGLSLVSSVAKHHRADVRLEDNNPGLRVVVHFPAF